MTNKKEESKKVKLNIFNHKMPKWVDCSWKRIPCGRESCRICGPMGQLRSKRLFRGEEAYSVETILQDIGKILNESFEKTLQGNRKFRVTKIYNPGLGLTPVEFPLVREVNSWRDSVFFLISQGYAFEKEWVNGEAVADLTWYANILCFKVFRQNLNSLELQKGKGHLVVADYKYTRSVLKICLEILRKSVSLNYIFDREHQDCWRELKSELLKMEDTILKI